MEGITSHETQLKVLSVVDNVEEELNKIEEENKAPEKSVVDQVMFGNTEQVKGVTNGTDGKAAEAG